MADKTETKKAPVKKPAEAKAPAKKAAAPKTPAAKAVPAVKPAAQKSGKIIKVTQIGSPIGRQEYQHATLIGLGLGKRHKTRELEDTPAVRGMIRTVQHLVKIEEAA